MECDLNNNSKTRSETWTDDQIAKKAGVGTGSVARYNKIMKSDDEELKEQVKTGQVKIGTAYRELKMYFIIKFFYDTIKQRSVIQCQH